jgi:hypothetical protein
VCVCMIVQPPVVVREAFLNFVVVQIQENVKHRPSLELSQKQVDVLTQATSAALDTCLAAE